MQASFGQCGAAFMTQAGAPDGGYCQTSCGRCPGVAAAPSAGSSPSPSPTSANTATGSSPVLGASPTSVAASSPTSATPAPIASSTPAGSLSPGTTSNALPAAGQGCTDQPPPGSSYSCVQQVSPRKGSLLCLGSCFLAHSIVHSSQRLPEQTLYLELCLCRLHLASAARPL